LYVLQLLKYFYKLAIDLSIFAVVRELAVVYHLFDVFRLPHELFELGLGEEIVSAH
jgi:hypothetical protein